MRSSIDLRAGCHARRRRSSRAGRSLARLAAMRLPRRWVGQPCSGKILRLLTHAHTPAATLGIAGTAHAHVRTNRPTADAWATAIARVGRANAVAGWPVTVPAALSQRSGVTAVTRQLRPLRAVYLDE